MPITYRIFSEPAHTLCNTWWFAVFSLCRLIFSKFSFANSYIQFVICHGGGGPLPNPNRDLFNFVCLGVVTLSSFPLLNVSLSQCVLTQPRLCASKETKCTAYHLQDLLRTCPHIVQCMIICSVPFRSTNSFKLFICQLFYSTCSWLWWWRFPPLLPNRDLFNFVCLGVVTLLSFPLLNVSVSRYVWTPPRLCASKETKCTAVLCLSLTGSSQDLPTHCALQDHLQCFLSIN